MKEAVEETIARIEPTLQADGGGIELVEVTDDGVVKVRLTGACGGCPMSQITLSQVVERTLKQEVDGIKKVEPVEQTRWKP